MESAKGFINEFEKNASRTAIIYKNVDTKESYRIDYSLLGQAVVSGANFLRNVLNLKPGQSVSYLFENSPEVLVLNLACFFCGLTACPLDIRRDTKEVALKKVVETDTKVIFSRVGEEFEDLAEYISSSLKIKSFGIKSFFDLLKIFGKDQDKKVLENYREEETSLILYTSGTISFPKGVMLSFKNLFYGAEQVAEWFKIGREDTFYIVLPLHHINSTIFSLSTLFQGGTLVLSSRYSKSSFFRDAASFGATMSSIVPTINIDLLEEEDSFKKERDNLRFKRIQIGSAPVSPIKAQEFVKKYGIALIQGYGSTETSLRATGVPLGISADLYTYLLKKNSIGLALSENQVALFDKKDKQIDKPYTDGEICIKGPNIMKGYLKHEEETHETLRNGFFYSGDLGYFEEIEGRRFYFLKGRLKEIIIKGGVNISPLFVEEQLRKSISWPRDLVVIGFPHWRFGEELGVIFVPKNKDHKKDLKTTLLKLKENKIKDLSPYETPKVAIVARDGDIPKTSTGKVQHIQAVEKFKEKFIFAGSFIGENKNYYFRIIYPDQGHLLREAVQAHNLVFPRGFSLDIKTLEHRATNGFVIGAFDSKGSIVGVLSGFFSNQEILKNGKNWNEITANGRFTRSNIHGDTAILVSAASISSKNKRGNTENINIGKVRLTEEEVYSYIKSLKDYVVRFHLKKKAGFNTGAKLYRIILNGNPRDLESLGVIVIFSYPPLDKLKHPKFTEEDKIGVGLVEAAILYSKENKKKKVFALSRLGEVYKYLSK